MQCGPTVLNTGGGETLQVPKTTAHSTAASAGPGRIRSQRPIRPSTCNLGCVQVRHSAAGRTRAHRRHGGRSPRLSRDAGRPGSRERVRERPGERHRHRAASGIMRPPTTGVTGPVPACPARLRTPTSWTSNTPSSRPTGKSRSCYWLAADKTIGGFRKIIDTIGRPIWEPSAVLGSPDLLLGKPLVADPFMPAQATGAKSIAFGDFSQYFVRLVGGVRFERSTISRSVPTLVTFRAILARRWDFGRQDRCHQDLHGRHLPE